MSTLNLSSYFNRIGYKGTPQVDLQTLRAIQSHHVRAIPFDNLDVLWNRTINMDLASVQEKLVFKKRGGYCFEQNTLIYHTLKEIGFDVRLLGARGMYRVPEGVVRPRTHMALKVILPEGEFLIDTGFGGFSLPEPLKIDLNVEIPTTHNPYRFISVAGEVDVEALVAGEWIKLYRITPMVMEMVDYVLQNWYISTHPNSHFRPHLMMARVADEGRYTMLNKSLSFYPLKGAPEKREMKSVEDFSETLARDFNLKLTEQVDLRQLGELFKTW